MSLPTECDVLVVGAGGAGLTAAIVAARAGAKVLLLEKMPEAGGTTAIAVGSITAACTLWQRRSGVTDSCEDFFEDLERQAGSLSERDNLPLKRVLARESADSLVWLRDQGLSFVGPFAEAPNRAPRMHNVVPIARAYVAALTAQSKRAGVRLVTGARVTKLVQSGGRVSGAEVRLASGHIVKLTVRRGVVLATGDYCSSKDLKVQHLGPDAAMIPGVNPGATGDGHVMGVEAGGQLANMDLASAEIRFVPPPTPPLLQRLPVNLILGHVLALLANKGPIAATRLLAKQMLVARMAPSPQLYAAGAILVNSYGERFADELSFTAYDIARQPSTVAHIVLNEAIARQFVPGANFISTAPGVAYAYFRDYQRGRPDLIKRGRTPGALAVALGMGSNVLEQTIARRNAEVAGAGERPSLTEGPYFSMGPLTPAFITTEGGFCVDEHCRVLDAAGQPVPGLWAAGSVGQSGMILSGQGLHIGWAITSGRIAGADAARE